MISVTATTHEQGLWTGIICSIVVQVVCSCSSRCALTGRKRYAAQRFSYFRFMLPFSTDSWPCLKTRVGDQGEEQSDRFFSSDRSRRRNMKAYSDFAQACGFESRTERNGRS